MIVKAGLFEKQKNYQKHKAAARGRKAEMHFRIKKKIFVMDGVKIFGLVCI